AVAYTVDVSKPDVVYQTAAEVRRRFGSIDVVVNNAGVGNTAYEDLFEMPDELNHRVIDVNLKSLLWMAKAFLPDMLQKRNGHFVCIASILSFVSLPASKRSTPYRFSVAV
ncbi:Dehydrogenase/reductase SDR family member 8 precursor, partial [Aphelenchoides avenae]